MYIILLYTLFFNASIGRKIVPYDLSRRPHLNFKIAAIRHVDVHFGALLQFKSLRVRYEIELWPFSRKNYKEFSENRAAIRTAKFSRRHL